MRLGRRPRSLLREWAMRLFVALGLIVAFSLLWAPTYEGPMLYVRFDCGAFYFAYRPNAAPTGFTLPRSTATPRFMFNAFPMYGPRGVQVTWRGWVSLAPLLGLLLVLILALWWAELRPVLPNHCRRCGYNLTGNTTGRCPECGEPS